MVEVDTRIFGRIAIEDDKIIRFDHGILGFPDLKDFTLILMKIRVWSPASSGCSLFRSRHLRCRS